MENKEEVLYGIFNSSMNPILCMKLLERGEDPLVKFVFANREFDKLSYGKDIVGRQVHLSQIDRWCHNNVVGGLIRDVLETGEEIITEYENKELNKIFYLKVCIPYENYICIIFSDVTDYRHAAGEVQKMYLQANETAEQLKYQVDLLTATKNELKRINRIHEIMFEVSSDGFFYKNYETGVFYAADSFYERFTFDGVRPIDNMSITSSLYELDVFSYSRAREDAIAKKQKNVSKEVRLLDGQIWLNLNLKFNYNDAGALVEEIGFFQDVTTIKKQQEELAYSAYYDSITGLMNRKYFTRLLEEDIEKIKEEDGEIQIIYIDVDDFKKINDSVGFQLGDKLIQSFARYIRKFENNRIRVGRFDSDEFVISIYDGTRNEANNMCLEIRKILMKPFELGRGISCMVTVSIGIAEYPTHGRRAIDVISNADVAVHHVKNNGKNGVAFFEDKMLELLLSKVETERNIKYALENDKFLLYYQPQYYTESQKLRGFEALVRMYDDQNGVVSPDSFIPVAETNGSIIAIGEWVIHQAFSDYVYWRREYGFNGIISINVSTIQFRQLRFEKMLFDAIEQYDMDPSKVEIEITESVFTENSVSIMETIKKIRQKGIKVSLDDFGTGYSSLSYLKNFQVDTLKIDKSFIDSLGKERKSDIIINSIVEMMRNLGLEIIAEGVETEEQFQILRKLQCHNIQGFLLGKPMSSGVIEGVIRTNM